MKPTVYISGPISGYQDLNKEAFQRMEAILIAHGFKVLNPHTFCAHIKSSDEADPKYYAEGIRQLTKSEDIIFLEGWQYSSGAQVERKVGQLLKLGIHEDLESLINKYSNQLY